MNRMLWGRTGLVWFFVCAGLAVGRADVATQLRTLAGAPARVVWCRQVAGEGGDPFATNAWYALMALDTEEGAERVLVPGPASVRKPLISPDGRVVVFTDHLRGVARAVDFAGGRPRDLGPGHAADVWVDPMDGRLWVYAIRGPLRTEAMMGSPVVRFPIDQPDRVEVVWSKTEVSTDNFQVTPDGTRAVGLCPWPQASWMELPEGGLKRLGRGCWTSRAPDDSRLAWAFDGAHRSFIVWNVQENLRWTVPANTAPGMDGAEVYHPRWGWPAHLLAVTGPYMAGSGASRIAFGGPRVEVYVGRFSDDRRAIVGWVQVTHNDVADYYPDVWAASAPPTERPAAPAPPSLASPLAAGRSVVEARLRAMTRTPAASEIHPYKQALVAHEYEVLRTVEGPALEGRILVLHWGVRDRRPVPFRRRLGETATFAVEPYDAHPELEGERVVMDMDPAGRPLYLAVEL